MKIIKLLSELCLLNLCKCKIGEYRATEYTKVNTYNYNGQRISKSDNGEVTYYICQNGVLLYTTDIHGNITSQNIVGPQENIIATIRYEDYEEVTYPVGAYAPTG